MTCKLSKVAAGAGRRVNGIVFEVAMAWGGAAEVICVPFEHRGRTWAVHHAVGGSPLTGPLYCVSDVERGWWVPDSEAATIDDARAAALANLNGMSEAQWNAAFAPTRRRQARSAQAIRHP
ncbi:hypothetical protein [Burkholderia ubonensis]|uniref:hypothetical protein n=1 Tax=Burkholderia ubonensis TaxID=101571 RepID=UPI0008FE3C62|nr:hypothetical protein [Burkholderia ubonensis]